MKLRKIITLTLVFVMLMSTASFAVTMYAPDGRTINVYDWEVSAYQNVGWYTSPVVTVYAPDGRSCLIFDYEVSAWESVGWIDGRKTSTIYAPDGRSATIPTWQLQAYLNVGWYLQPISDPSDYYYPGTTVPKYENIVNGTYMGTTYGDDGNLYYVYSSSVIDYVDYGDYLVTAGFEYCDGNQELYYGVFTYTNNYNTVSMLFYYDSDLVYVTCK